MYCHIHHCHYHHCNCVPTDSKEKGGALTQEELVAYTQEMKDELKDYTVDLKDQIFSYIDVGLNPVEINNSINSLREQDTYILRTLTNKIDELNNTTNLSMFNLRTRVTDLEGQSATVIQDLSDRTQRIEELESNLSSLPFEEGVLADTFVTVTSQSSSMMPRTLRDKLSEQISVKDFGAIGENRDLPVSQWYTEGSENYRGYADLAAVQVDYPHVTSPEDSIDWVAIQAAYNYGSTNYGTREILHPSGQYVINKPLTVPPSGYGCATLRGLGSTRIVASNDFPLYEFLLTIPIVGYGGNNFRADGMTFYGNFRAKGVWIQSAQEWNLNNIMIWECYIGLQLSDTYYGGVSGTSSIRQCLVGVQFSDPLIPLKGGESGEVNTIEFTNLKINFSDNVATAANKRKFYPLNDEETIEQYQDRVLSIGYNLEGTLLGVNIVGSTLEGMDYGFYGSKHKSVNTGGFGQVSTLININQCYFEAIKKAAAYFKFFGPTESDLMQDKTVNMSEMWCTLGGKSNRFILESSGNYSLYNSPGAFVEVNEISPYRVSVKTDCANVIYNKGGGARSGSAYTYIDNTRKNGSRYVSAARYSKKGTWGEPTAANFLAHRDDINNVILATPVPHGTYNYKYISKINNVLGVTTRPVTFQHTPRNQTKSLKYSGPVIPDASGKLFMMMTTDGVGVELKEIKNKSRLAPPVGSVEASDVYYASPKMKDGTYYCVDTEQDIQVTAGKAEVSGMSVYGTGKDFANNPGLPSAFSGPAAWNIEIQYGYNNYGGVWNWGPDWFGHKSRDRAVGTLAQRPVTPTVDFMVYYASDEGKYYQWKSSEWSEYTP